MIFKDSLVDHFKNNADVEQSEQTSHFRKTLNYIVGVSFEEITISVDKKFNFYLLVPGIVCID